MKRLFQLKEKGTLDMVYGLYTSLPGMTLSYLIFFCLTDGSLIQDFILKKFLSFYTLQFMQSISMSSILFRVRVTGTRYHNVASKEYNLFQSDKCIEKAIKLLSQNLK